MNMALISAKQAGGLALAALLLAPRATLAQLGAGKIPFAEALDAGAVAVERLNDINRHALVLGNGDLSALLWERNGALCLRVTKNDVWDASLQCQRALKLPI